MRLTQLRTRRLGVLCALMLASITGAAAQAFAYDGVDQRAVQRAASYLSIRETGEGILNFVHMGADYHGHTYLRTNNVVDRDGYRVPGHFALVYRFHWEDDGVTDLAFLCNERGGIYDVQVTYTNAVLNQPFLLANAAIQILGNLVIDNYKDRMSREQLRLAHEFVDHADSKGLLELALMLGESARD